MLQVKFMAEFKNPSGFVMVIAMISVVFVSLGCYEKTLKAENMDTRYRAYWLGPKDATGASGYFPVFLTKGPIEHVNFSALHAVKDAAYSADELLAFPAVVFITYRKDSIWNMDGRPFKPANYVKSVDYQEKTIVQKRPGLLPETFHYQ